MGLPIGGYSILESQNTLHAQIKQNPDEKRKKEKKTISYFTSCIITHTEP